MLRAGIIGAGHMGQFYARAISEYQPAKLVAIADTEREKAEKLARRYEAEGFYDDYNEMLMSEELDACVVATPDFAHKEPAVAVLESGRHLLLEKPLATTKEDCEAIRECARRSECFSMVNYGNRHRPPVKVLRSEIEAGSIGEINFIYSRLYEKLAKTWTLSWAERTTPASFLMSHIVDTVLWLTGKKVKEVTARAVRGVVKKCALSEADSYVGLVSFEDGALGCFDACWAMPDSFVPFIEFKIELRGMKGVLRGDLFPNDLHRFASDATCLDHSLDYRDHSGRAEGWWYNSLRYFVDSIIKGTPPSPSIEEAYEVSKIVIAIEYSAERGFPVAPDEI